MEDAVLALAIEFNDRLCSSNSSYPSDATIDRPILFLSNIFVDYCFALLLLVSVVSTALAVSDVADTGTG